MKRINLLGLLLLVVIVFVYVSCFEVSEGSVAVGNQHKIYLPGLQIKWPWEDVTLLSTAHQLVDVQADSFTWTISVRLVQPKLYLKNNANQSLDAILKAEWSILTARGQPATATVTPASLDNIRSEYLQALQQDPVLTQKGIAVDDLILSNATISDANQAVISQKMQGLSAAIVQNILSAGQAEATGIRNVAQARFLAVQQQALAASVAMMGASHLAAVKLLVPVYQRNPTLFKQYMQAKAQWVKNLNS